jgi:hypothetical protein
LVDTSGLEVESWGNVDDAKHHSEVVEILVAPLVAAVIGKVADFLYDRIKERKDRKKGPQTGDKTAELGVLKAVTLRRSDGTELVWEFHHQVTAARAAEVLAEFSQGESVDRILKSSG